ncbi:MAG: hypothetical protein Q9175_002214 [Cornicularia normoerica]
MTSGRDSEQAPLLADDARDDEADSVEDAPQANGKVSKREKSRIWLRKSWDWLLNNLMTAAIILLLLGGLIALLVYFAVAYNQDSGDSDPEVPDTICITPACVIAASKILENMSPRYHVIDPCHDFDQFVCEGWQEKYDLRADQRGAFTGTIMAENSQQILRHVLESPYSVDDYKIEIDSSAKRDIFEKVQTAYNACMDEEVIKDVGSTPLLDVLRKVEELFPATRPDINFPLLKPMNQKGLLIEGENQLSKTLTYLTSIGLGSLISFYVTADDKDPDVIVPFIAAPRQPGLPTKEYYKDPELVVRYAKTIGHVLEALLAEAKSGSRPLTGLWTQISTESAELVESIVVLESKLAQATPDEEDAEDVTKYYNPMNLDQIKGLLPQLSVEHLISTLAPADFKPEKLIVGSPSYLKALSEILRGTSAETLQAYFVWKTVQAYAYRIEDDALKPLKRFNNVLLGKDPDASEERWRTCIKVADDGLGWILSKFFVEKAFSEEAKHFGDQIVSDIKVQFIKKLRGAEWMSKDVRDLGIEKVHNIMQKIGYPTKSPDIRDSAALEEYYADVNITSTAFFENALSIAKFTIEREWSALGKPTNRDEWVLTADTVNAYYNPAGNEIVFPAGIMQAPVFYDPSIPQYLSYGAFGSVSGHELSHAFDSMGRHYDETGNFTDWWDNSTVEAFENKAQCFINQYHEFTVPNPNGEPLHVNGRLTLGENIADSGGVNAAFAAWKDAEGIEPGQLLPGLQTFTKEQIFFISYANWWCGKMRPEAAVNLVYRDPHAPTRARILGTMANSADFRESFGCPVKEPTFCENQLLRDDNEHHRMPMELARAS